MNRSHSTRAIVLKNSRIGEIHKGVVMLTADSGLVSAIAHGAYSQKGKLRGTTNLFCTGTVYLYTDPVRDSVKITDFDVSEFYSPIRDELGRFYTASLWAETVLKTYGTGGESEHLFGLLLSALDELSSRPSADAPLVSIHYFWRFLRLSGTQPDIEHCARTGEPFADGEPAFYSPMDEGFCAPHVAGEEMPRWSAGVLAYLRHTGEMELGEALRVSPPAESIPRMKRVIYLIVQEHVESPLQTLRSGSGIL